MQALKFTGLRQKEASRDSNKKPSFIPEKLERKILLGNSERIWHLGLISASFIVFFLILDYVRWRSGLFAHDSVYLWLFISHLAAVSSSIAAIILFRNNRHLVNLESKSLRRIQFAYLTLFFIPYVVMGILSIIERGSLMLFCLLLIVLNLVFIIRQTERIVLNVLMLLILWGSVLIRDHGDFQCTIAKLSECLGCVITTFFMGQLQYRIVIKNIQQDHLYQEQMAEIASERKRSNELLLNLLPKSAVLELTAVQNIFY